MSLSLLGSCIMTFRKAYMATGAAAGGSSGTVSGNGNVTVSGTVSSNGSSGDGQQQQGQQHGDGAREEDEADRQVHVYLPPRSLLVMSGESRYAW